MGISAVAAKAITALRDAFVKGAISERQLERQEKRILEKDAAGLPERYGRRAAPSSGSRQNERRLDIFYAMRVIKGEYAGEPRSVRRRMARELGKRTWRKRMGLPDPVYAHA